MLTIDDIRAAHERIQPVARHTPLLPVHIPTGVIWLKPEMFQVIGSFKIRGAYNCIAALPDEVRKHGVIAYSSGNHAQGVAYAARHLGVPAVIVMPNNAPAIKIAATRGYGAEVVLYDPVTESRETIAAQLMQGKAWTLIPPFNDWQVMAGQGTIGLEICTDLPVVDLVLTPVGGGGLLSGIATAVKTLHPQAKMIGVEPAIADDARQSLHTGQIVSLAVDVVGKTIADGVRTLHIGDLTLAQMRHYVDDIITVSEFEIQMAVVELFMHHKLVVEPAGALAYAALRFHRDILPAAKHPVAVLSGGNVDPALFKLLLDASPTLES